MKGNLMILVCFLAGVSIATHRDSCGCRPMLCEVVVRLRLKTIAEGVYSACNDIGKLCRGIVLEVRDGGLVAVVTQE